MGNNQYKKIYLALTILMIISTFLGGTLAYFQWNTNTSQQTNIVLTVQPNFMCSADGGGNITEDDVSLVPAECTNSNYAIQRTITATPVISGEQSITMNLWLDINSISSGLSESENFKYALTTDPNSCTNELIKTGNFKGKTAGNSVELFSYREYNTSTTDIFYLYIWLDKTETSQSTMDQSFDISLNGVCENKPEPEGEILYNLVESIAVPDNISSKYVSNSTGIDFGVASGDNNGKGVYTIANTLNNTYPVHYYRGPIENNNVLFANFCWKIVRTTDTGGTKLVYNGTPTNGICNNTGASSQLETRSKFNTTQKLEAAGYSYGKIHTFEYKTIANITNQTIFANNITYDKDNSKYILNEEQYIKDENLTSSNLNENLKNHHYTCFTTNANDCENKIYFAYMIRNSTIFFVQMTDGETIETLLETTFNNSSNTTSSEIKTVVDNWYAANMTNYTQYLEDTVWCNDKSIYSANGWTTNGNLFDLPEEKLNFGANDRLVNRKAPSLYCQNLSDRFTVSTTNGNGALTYPAALLTLDETSLAGYVWFEDSSNNYLNTDKIWWTMTPTIASANLMYISVIYSIADNVQSDYTKNGAGGVRPSISLKYGTTIKSGYGTPEQPYIIDENL